MKTQPLPIPRNCTNQVKCLVYSGTPMLTAAIMSLWMCAPLAPLNPLEQDTANSVSLQFSFGLNSPSEILRAAPEFDIGYEMLTVHPFIARIGLEYKSGALSSSLHPSGPLQTYTISFQAIMYRGTKELTGYFGFGPLYTFNNFSPNQLTRDSLQRKTDIDGVRLNPTFGYRIVFGARYYRNYSLEVRITETYPVLEQTSIDARTVYSLRGETIKTSSISLSLGYLLKL